MMDDHSGHMRAMINLPEKAWPKLEDLNGDLRNVAELIGIKNALLLAQEFDGSPIRLYGYKHLKRKWRDQCMRRDYDTNKYTYIELGRKYGVCDRQVSYILARPDDRQVEMFDVGKMSNDVQGK